jgi:hypothetical protein
MITPYLMVCDNVPAEDTVSILCIFIQVRFWPTLNM